MTRLIITFLLMIVFCFIHNRNLLYYLQLCKYKVQDYMCFVFSDNNTQFWRNQFVVICYTIFLVLVFKVLEVNDIVFNGLYTLLAPLVLLSFILQRQKTKVKVVYTKRFVRLFVLNMVFDSAIIILYEVFVYKYISVAILPLIALGLPYLVVIAKYLLDPIEQCINRRYIRKARAKIQKFEKLKIIGITGSAGKTTIKHILFEVLKHKYNCAMTPKNYNTTLGVVKTINEVLREEDEILILEMGADELGDIARICSVVQPDIAILSNIGLQHLETFGSEENIIKTKFEIVENMKDEGVAIVNIDDDNIRRTVGMYTKNIVKVSPRASVRNTQILLDKQVFELNDMIISTRLLGKHNIENIALCYHVCKYLGVTDKEFQSYISSVLQVSNRLQIKRLRDNIILDDSYNGNVVGVENALQVLSQFEGYNKVIITPGVVELGQRQHEENVKIGQYISQCCDEAYIVNLENMEALKEGIGDKCTVYETLDFRDIDFASFHKCAILICSDLPDNYF